MKSIAIALAAMLMTAPALAGEVKPKPATLSRFTVACIDENTMMQVNMNINRLIAAKQPALAASLLKDAEDIGICRFIDSGEPIHFIGNGLSGRAAMIYVTKGNEHHAYWVFPNLIKLK